MIPSHVMMRRITMFPSTMDHIYDGRIPVIVHRISHIFVVMLTSTNLLLFLSYNSTYSAYNCVLYIILTNKLLLYVFTML
uniref:Uncharacterized protein n=1 Tax=Paramormyrops kingsleyae TaxID=1676925 RepID=A0A3B3R443_9TELE